MNETRFDIRRAKVRLLDPPHPCGEKRLLLDEVLDMETLFALADEMMGAVRRRDVAQNIGDNAHAVQIYRRGIVFLGIALHEKPDRASLPDRLLRGGDRGGPADGDGHDDAREQHEAAHWHDDQRVWRKIGVIEAAALGGRRADVRRKEGLDEEGLSEEKPAKTRHSENPPIRGACAERWRGSR